MNAPLWLEILIVGAAAWSTFQLLAFDTILDGPRRRALRLGREWETEGDPVPDNYRLKTAQFLTCPYCAGFWIWVAWISAYFVTDYVVFAALLMGGRVMIVAGHNLLGMTDDQAASPDAELVAGALERIAKKQA